MGEKDEALRCANEALALAVEGGQDTAGVEKFISIIKK